MAYYHAYRKESLLVMAIMMVILSRPALPLLAVILSRSCKEALVGPRERGKSDQQENIHDL